MNMLCEAEEGEDRELRPSSIVRSLAPAICAEAQRLYDEWEQDAEGIDEVYGNGGICEQIAQHAIAGVLAGAGINVASGGSDEHAAIIAQFADGVFEVDIPFCVYERGGGYKWRKLPDVMFEPSDIVLDRLERDPAKFDLYSEW